MHSALHTSKFCSFSRNSEMVESAKDFSLCSLATFWKKIQGLNMKNWFHYLDCHFANYIGTCTSMCKNVHFLFLAVNIIVLHTCLNLISTGS